MSVKAPSAIEKAVPIDHAMAQIEREIEFLLNITPLNADQAWTDFERSGFTAEPVLRSRTLGFDADLVRRRLYQLDVENVGDVGLAELLRAKRDQLARQVTLLADRDTSRFLYGSLQLFGDVGDTLLDEAARLLDEVEPKMAGDRRVGATGFAGAAEEELDYYRRTYEGFDLQLEVRSDVSDLMVSHGHLFIPAQAYFRSRRVDALVHHEVGTHMVTFANGSAQPLQMLAVGLPGYEETQEGLAVLAEYLVGGLDPQRVRLLAARVIAVARVIERRDFLEIFGELHDSLGFAPKTAWAVTIRVTRAGGLTKDVIYLRGIARVLEFARERKDLSSLLVGKLSLDHVPLIEDLLERGVLRPPWITPRWLAGEDAQERLARVYDGISVGEMLDGDGGR